MLHLNCLAWEARFKIEFRSFMVTNFTTIGGAVTEDEVNGRRFPWKAMNVRENDSVEV